MCERVFVCVRGCVCVCVCARACVCVCVCVRLIISYEDQSGSFDETFEENWLFTRPVDHDGYIETNEDRKKEIKKNRK